MNAWYCMRAIIVMIIGLPSVVSAQQGGVRYIDPRIGNVGQLLEPTRPLAHLPNQMIRMAPDRKDYFDDQITSFPLSIVSHRLGQVFSLKPSVKGAGPANWEGRMTWDHDLEVNKPWYYSTYLIDDGITVEFAPGKKAGFFRFRFPASGEPALLLGVYNDGPAQWKFLSGSEVSGMETYHGDIKVYMYGKFSRNARQGLEGNRAWISFPKAVGLVEFRYAVSYIGVDEAKRHFEEELANRDFQSLAEEGKRTWEGVMDRVKVEGGTEAQKRSFYTALYRCSERMVNITEDGSYYSGFDTQVHKDSRPFYTDDWVWDTYLALHPLRMILNPAQEEDMLQSYVRMYEQSGWMPTFPVLFGDHACMNGFHSSIVFLDAYRKGLKHFDIMKAFEGMKKNSTEATLLPWRNGEKTALDNFYHTAGYFPALHKDEKETEGKVHEFERRQAVAITLGASYDDWAVSQLAKDLGRKDDETLFGEKAKNYRHLWNPAKQMFFPKDDKGNWIDIDPKFDGGAGGRDYYDENNGYTYLWQVQQDIPALIDLMGGKAGTEKKLDQLFREGLDRSKPEFWSKFPDATGLVGQFCMGNEPSFHIPYLYNYTDAPWKTQQRIRFLLDAWFKDNIFGIPGDEDGGGMSAFVVFSSMGFYPVTPGLPVYTIGSPLFSKVTIHLTNGKQFSLTAHNCSVLNKYIQRATMNGVELRTPWFTHEQLMNGGRLVLEMGPKPNKKLFVIPKI
ncbi:GH92 family glycosyl hydrolase [Flavitalea sp. BT771]|uniref:GH92 family glycosyl hydrolase n=2 Tax=Flavitalea sp. BT771 TaxID=3063329 RepID=UPI0034C69E2C